MRRMSFLALLLWGLLCMACQTPSTEKDALQTLRAQLTADIKGIDAQVGIAIISPEGDTLTLNNDHHFPLMSVYKFHQALAVADQMLRQGISPEDSVCLPEEELKSNTYSPLKEKYTQGDVSLEIRDLFKYTLELSDNNVCDFLFKHYVSPQATERFLKHKAGMKDFNIQYTEAQMGTDIRLCYENWTTPYAAATLLRDFMQGTVIDEPYLSLIKNNMLNCHTGQQKLAFPLQGTKAQIGHKTGAGPHTPEGKHIANNDLAFIRLPNGNAYILAVFVKDALLPISASDQIHADISKMVYQHLNP